MIQKWLLTLTAGVFPRWPTQDAQRPFFYHAACYPFRLAGYLVNGGIRFSRNGSPHCWTRLPRVWREQGACPVAFWMIPNPCRRRLAESFGWRGKESLCFCFDALSVCLSTVYHVCKLVVLSTFFPVIAVCIVVTLSVPLSAPTSKCSFSYLKLNHHINNTCCRLNKVNLPDASVTPQTRSTIMTQRNWRKKKNRNKEKKIFVRSMMSSFALATLMKSIMFDSEHLISLHFDVSHQDQLPSSSTHECFDIQWRWSSQCS